MAKKNLDEVERKILEKYARHNKRKRPKMRVSGASVKCLQRIIKNK